MRYDLELVSQLCQEIGLRATSSAGAVAIELAAGVSLVFHNAEQDVNCLVGFNGTPWHVHDGFTFVDGRGNYIEMDYLDVISGLADGRVLVCERAKLNQVTDRWLVHKDHNDEFQHMERGEHITVWRPTTVK
jgi:hypothetical protein